MNAAAAINNLSFYQTESSALGRSRLAVAKRKTCRPSLPGLHLCLSFDPPPPLLILSNASDDEAAAQLQHGRRA